MLKIQFSSYAADHRVGKICSGCMSSAVLRSLGVENF